MAEFCEVMRQAARICSQQTQCTGCPLVNLDGGLCELRRGYMRKFSEFVAREVERIVMDWATKHPEPKYPTWKEWQDKNFPNDDALMRPCIFESEEYFNCKQENGCEKCMNKPIPADIAEKLGIKPIGGESDENA